MCGLSIWRNYSDLKARLDNLTDVNDKCIIVANLNCHIVRSIFYQIMLLISFIIVWEDQVVMQKCKWEFLCLIELL